MKTMLKWLGYEIVYVCDWGAYRHRYDSLDLAAMRPIHQGMSVAPPWARMSIRRTNKGETK